MKARRSHVVGQFAKALNESRKGLKVDFGRDEVVGLRETEIGFGLD